MSKTTPAVTGHSVAANLVTAFSRLYMMAFEENTTLAGTVKTMHAAVIEAAEALKTLHIDRSATGFKLLPRDPTDAMLRAIEEYFHKWDDIVGTDDDDATKANCWSALQCYRAIYDAAPLVESTSGNSKALLELLEDFADDDPVVEVRQALRRMDVREELR